MNLIYKLYENEYFYIYVTVICMFYILTFHSNLFELLNDPSKFI